MNMLRKGQVAKVEPVLCGGSPEAERSRSRSVVATGVEKGAVRERAKFIAEILGVVA